ncbi:3-oxoadipate enol-lactonase [Myxococcaceae bacterium]|jgi:pimeloyl-ACP methyl ester carboxylesterase|nr:3-oxoadipate enol-lactonase [Myxococcaceae bacterium]
MPEVRAAGRKVHYELHGPESGAPLVLVMGLGGSCRGWLPLQVPELSRERRVLIYDTRGVGESEDPGGPFSTADLADDLAALLDALAIRRADVLGAFLGGMTAQEFALRHPLRLDRLLLVGSYARADAKRRMLLEKWRDMARVETPLSIQVRERLLWTLEDDTMEVTDLIDSMVEFFTREGSPVSNDVFARQCEACIGHDTRDRLRQIHARTLVLCGRHDQLTPPKFQRELADEIPGARLVTLSFGAHLVMAESAQRFNQIVLQFLAEDRSGPRDRA